VEATIPSSSDGQNRPPPMSGAGHGCHSYNMPNRTVPIKVFLAEDSGLIRDRVTSILSERAIEIVGHAETPQDSIDGILAVHPDVVVLDVQLAGGTGLEVLRAVRELEPGIAFVMFTINSAAAFRKRYLDEGARSFLDKATEFPQLADAVEQASGRMH
jgi:DNA-binding NarL/FixJ family response regulator